MSLAERDRKKLEEIVARMERLKERAKQDSSEARRRNKEDIAKQEAYGEAFGGLFTALLPLAQKCEHEWQDGCLSCVARKAIAAARAVMNSRGSDNE